MRGVTSMVAALVFVATAAEAQITSVSVNKCLQRKLLEVRKTAAADIQCHAGFRSSGDQARYDKCKARVELTFTGGSDPSRGSFERIEAQFPPDACRTYDDQYDMFYVEIWAHLTTHLSFTIPGIPNACDAQKMKCARRYSAASMKCYADAARATIGGSVSSVCLSAAADKLIGTPQSCLDRAHAKYATSCSSTANAPVIREIVDGFSRFAVCRADPGNPGCPTPTPTRSPTPTPTRTPTPTLTPTPQPTSTIPGVCGNGLVEYGEFCDPPGVGSCGPEFPCTACDCACPSTIDFAIDATSADTVVDLGWVGLGHHQPVATNGGMTLAVDDCQGTDRPCGTCMLTGPILAANADAGALHNRRCTNDTAIKCADDAPCLAGGGTCESFFGTQWPFAAGGVGACLVSQFNGPVSGTVNVESGALAADVALSVRVHTSLAPGTVDRPCPRCVGDGAANDGLAGGTCDAGPRTGLACDANGSVPGRPDFGTPSLDCPPDPSLLVGTLPLRFAHLTTTPTTKSLSATSPICKGDPSERCYCDTCNNASAEPCSSSAECPMSGGNPGVCGGSRCLGGTNAGNLCGGSLGGSSACPGGTCGRPGEPTKPNSCVDDTAGDGFCVDNAPVDDGRTECLVGFQPPFYFGGGPVDATCSNHPQRWCFSDADCDGVSGACGPATPRRCFAGGGYVGGHIAASGEASPPTGDVTSVTLSSIFCVGASGSNALNVVNGLPGPARITLRGTTTAHP